MSRFVVLVCAVVLTMVASAAWHWPFGDGRKKPPRLSELMEPSSMLIDEATDLAAEGKTSEAIEKYRAALVELDKVEREHPERASSPEFATLRNKRAYVSAAIDSMLMSQARDNAKTVAVSDTTALEKRLAEEEAAKKKAGQKDAGKKSASRQPASKPSVAKPSVAKPVAESKTNVVVVASAVKSVKPSKPLTRREQIIVDISNRDFDAADLGIREWLRETPNNAAALNLKAAMESERGDYKAAERALDQAISSNPRNYFAYYNMAQLVLDRDPSDKTTARRYYETGRVVGGPEDLKLEARFK